MPNGGNETPDSEKTAFEGVWKIKEYEEYFIIKGTNISRIIYLGTEKEEVVESGYIDIEYIDDYSIALYYTTYVNPKYGNIYASEDNPIFRTKMWIGDGPILWIPGWPDFYKVSE